MWMQLVCYTQVQKSPFTTTIAIFLSVKENARVQFWFSALLFPKRVLKVVRWIGIVIRV